MLRAQRLVARVAQTAATRWPAQLRRLSAVPGTPEYEEEQAAEFSRSDEFYESEGVDRRYYFFVDSLGRLFGESTHPKGITTSIKSDKFLDFFFSQIRPNAREHAGADASIVSQYPWISPCGPEMNFVRAADTAVVFTELRKSPEGGHELVYGGTLRTPMVPERLRMSPEGRLYHLLSGKRLGRDVPCLVRSSVALGVAEGIELSEEGAGGRQAGVVRWEGQTYPLLWLDEGEEARRRPQARCA
ncbi:hypothetical protein FNF31_00588 [Cafeteria roenbergensis]|uniref:Uncharacterized protein n=1 Tax=Cafeteria roenbergensis TaxID=33653 RepID=A0A5A8DI01_CAFRO|nr:hypothetical protein FNF28_04237 [Cafeteria roenbergensis]KAA0168089.1 hypothetical protein FNF31_00588 [Cafeteria roenbergensis]